MKTLFERMREAALKTRKAWEESLVRSMMGQTTDTEAVADSKPHAFEHFKVAMERAAAMSRQPLLVSSVAFPVDRILCFEAENRACYGAHPDYWAKVPKGLVATEESIQASGNIWTGGIEIVDIDVNSKGAHDFYDALSKAIGKL